MSKSFHRDLFLYFSDSVFTKGDLLVKLHSPVSSFLDLFLFFQYDELVTQLWQLSHHLFVDGTD